MNISHLIKTIAIMVGFGLFTMFANAAPPRQDVNVVNTPDVNVVNTPGVTIENSTLEPVPVIMDEVTRIPYQGKAIVSIPAAQTSALATFSPSLPTSGMLVIEQISIYANLPADVEYGYYAVRTRMEGDIYFWSFNSPILSPPSFTPRHMRGTETVRLYHDLSYAPPEAVFFRFNWAYDATAYVRISGYIVPEGSPSLAP